MGLSNPTAAPLTDAELKFQGPPGMAGPQGGPGEQGPPGDAGSQGDRGMPGATGSTGPTGPTGPVGPQGDTGITGSQGDIGPEGPQGEAGPPGPEGPQGVPGERGPYGPQGDAGLLGPQGDAGERGPAGGDGPPGPTGEPGYLRTRSAGAVTNATARFMAVPGLAFDAVAGSSYEFSFLMPCQGRVTVELDAPTEAVYTVNTADGLVEVTGLLPACAADTRVGARFKAEQEASSAAIGAGAMVRWHTY